MIASFIGAVSLANPSPLAPNDLTSYEGAGAWAPGAPAASPARARTIPEPIRTIRRVPWRMAAMLITGGRKFKPAANPLTSPFPSAS